MSTSIPSPIWHPFTQHGLEPDAIEVVSARGAWLQTVDGDRLFDAISSWWVTTHGHSHPKIVDAIQQAAGALDQIIFAGMTHRPAEMVARRLVDMTPDGLDHVFFSDSGSTSVEVALKMALGYWRNIGIARHRIIAMEHAYHGDTVGTMSAGARGVFNAAYKPLLFDVARVPYPHKGEAQATLDALEAHCKRDDTAAFICEPLVLGAGGMLMYSADTLRDMHAICSKHNVLFIADEVMTGFGRTGSTFSVQQADIQPDILCLAKGLTGGSLPLAVTLCNGAIYDAHLSDDRARMFFHSSSYTANPIACAAAVANLDIWQDETKVLEGIRRLTDLQVDHLKQSVSKHRSTQNMRQCGTIAAFDIASKDDAGYLSDIALKLRRAAAKRRVLIRPLGNTVYVMPPYCTTADDLATAYDAIIASIDEVLS